MTRGRGPHGASPGERQLAAAAAGRDTQVTLARTAVLELANTLVDDGRLTVGAAAETMGISRVTLSRALNANRHSGRYGGGHAPPPDGPAQRVLADAHAESLERIDAAERELLDELAGQIDRRELSIAVAAETLGVHRSTLTRQLREHRASGG